MRAVLLCLAFIACQSQPEVAEIHGTPPAELRVRAIEFLETNMPERDRGKLSAEFLGENIELALQARTEFPWAASVPDDLFLNDVLPYAVFDEPRDPWRRELLELSRPIVASAKTAGEAAQALNRELFKQINLHYNTNRKRPNQSFVESKELGRATCTGLSIVLVEACRSVGIPARAAGTPSWSKKPGNHTWVEIWDGDWHFAGADEYDAGGLDRGWFVGDAGDALADEPLHRIYATSWKREGLYFPLAWSEGDQSVAAVNVTGRYAKKASAPAATNGIVFVRVFERRGGERVVCDIELVAEDGTILAHEKSRAGTSDLNDMPQFTFARAKGCQLNLRRGNEARKFDVKADSASPLTLELYWDELASDSRTSAADSMTKEAAVLERTRAVDARLAELRLERAAEMEAKALIVGDKTMRWLEKSFGDAPEGKRSLWISMHGGGGAPADVNDQQWKNQIGLYQPSEGFYVAPRAPTDNWNLWHEAHIDPMFSRLIEDFVALRGVDPDRVYLMGYSAGGDGVWQLAPRMADRFAAASMMAGHPNEAQLFGLRNLPFAIFMGGDDKAYDRNKVAQERATQLDSLRAADPGGYEHFVRIYEGLGHWMQKKDAEALPWMAEHTRVAWPKKVVWFQDDVVHDRFYWLGRAPGTAKAGERIEGEVDGQTIRIAAGEVKGLQLWLSDELLDLDKSVSVIVDGKTVFEGRVSRSATVLRDSLTARLDARLAACAKLVLEY